MSDLLAVVVGIGTTPPGQNTGIDTPPTVLKSSISILRLPVLSCSTLIVNEVEPDGEFFRVKCVIFEVAVQMNVCASERSTVATSAAMVALPTLSEYVLKNTLPSTSSVACGAVELIPTELIPAVD